MKKIINFDKLSGFNFKIAHSISKKETHFYQIDSHVHDECELYVNVSGDISFMVENKLYDVERGNIIIAKPNEYHNCIYRSEAEHEHFWILMSPNDEILKPLLRRHNEGLIILEQNDREKLIDICYKILNSDDNLEKYMLMFQLLHICEKESKAVQESHLSQEIDFFLEYINKNIKEEIQVKEIAKKNYISVSTLERKFKECLNMSPSEYIRDRRLCLAANCLRKGMSVQEAAMENGFCDSSNFIIRFKRKFNMTPLKYQKQFLSKSY